MWSAVIDPMPSCGENIFNTEGTEVTQEDTEKKLKASYV